MADLTGQNDLRNGAALSALSLRRVWPLGLIVAAAIVLLVSGLGRGLSGQMLVESRDQLVGFVAAHFGQALTLYMTAWAALALFALPGGILLTLTGGFLFGAATATIATVLPATLGASLLFLAVRTSIGKTLRERAGPWLTKFRDGFARDAASYLLFLRLVPLFPYWLVNLAPGCLGVSLRTFVWTTLIGTAPGTFAYALAGAGLDGVIAAAKQAHAVCVASGAADCTLTLRVSQLATPELLAAFGLLGVLALLPVLWKVWRRTARKSPSVGMSDA